MYIYMHIIYIYTISYYTSILYYIILYYCKHEWWIQWRLVDFLNSGIDLNSVGSWWTPWLQPVTPRRSSRHWKRSRAI